MRNRFPLKKPLKSSIRLRATCRIHSPLGIGAIPAISLAARDEQRLDWPIAKARRRHVHGLLDAHELPVRHETRCAGRPHTLVWTKTVALFDREAARRRSWQTDLDWLAGK